MKNFILSVYTFIFFGIGTSYSATILKRAVCPALTDDAQQIINLVQGLRDELNQVPECQQIDEKLGKVSELISFEKWGEVKELFKTSDAPALEGEDVEQLTGLAHEVSKILVRSFLPLDKIIPVLKKKIKLPFGVRRLELFVRSPEL